MPALPPIAPPDTVMMMNASLPPVPGALAPAASPPDTGGGDGSVVADAGIPAEGNSVVPGGGHEDAGGVTNGLPGSADHEDGSGSGLPGAASA